MDNTLIEEFLEGKDTSLDMSTHIQEQIQQVYLEGRLARSMATVAAALGGAWGAAKLTTSFLSQFNVSELAVNLIAGTFRSTGAYLHYFNVFEHFRNTGMGAGESVQALVQMASVGGASAQASALAAMGTSFLPVAIASLMTVGGGILVVTTMRKLFELNPTIEQQYNKLSSAVDKRDQAGDELKRITRNVELTGIENVNEVKPVRQAIKNVDRTTGRIMTEANKLERMVMRNITTLDAEEVETLTNFIEIAKNGLVSNKRGSR